MGWLRSKAAVNSGVGRSCGVVMALRPIAIRMMCVVSVSGASLGSGCQFDRAPLGTMTKSRDDGVSASKDAGKTEPTEPTVSDASSPSQVSDATLADAMVTTTMPPDKTGSSSDEDSGVTTTPDAGPPTMMGGLQCGGLFCGFTTAPVEACCTGDQDVQKHAARAAGRCGVNLGKLDAKTYGEGCWQRDQLGIIDDRCPGATVSDAKLSEPGCCADDGQCGTNNADQKLGCRHALGGELRACGEPVTGAACDPTGVYGFKTTVDASWQGRQGGLTAITEDGRGDIEVFLMMKIEQVDAATSAVRASGRVCGFKIPPFYSDILCESYQPIFPAKIWESSALPQLTLDGRYDCAAQGCVLSINPQTYLLGFDMSNPEAPWPTANQTSAVRCAAGVGVQCFPDHDSDGIPGVSLDFVTSGPAPNPKVCNQGKYQFRAPPLSDRITAIFDGVRRTDHISIGARMRLGVSTRLDETCATGVGSGIAEYVNSRAHGCVVQEGTRDYPGLAAGPNEACNSDQSHFVDLSLPAYKLLSAGERPDARSGVDTTPSRGPSVGVVRFGPLTQSVSCAEVRDAMY
jgi:hypothetical protein